MSRVKILGGRDEYLINISRATDSKLVAFLISATANRNIETIS